jgi:hypothetical protein
VPLQQDGCSQEGLHKNVSRRMQDDTLATYSVKRGYTCCCSHQRGDGNDVPHMKLCARNRMGLLFITDRAMFPLGVLLRFHGGRKHSRVLPCRG